MDYKVSVVVPIFNIFPYLEDCINKESAIKFKETIVLSSKDENFKKKD